MVPRATTVTLEKNVRLTKQDNNSKNTTTPLVEETVPGRLLSLLEDASQSLGPRFENDLRLKGQRESCGEGHRKPCESLFNRLVPSEPTGFAFNC